MGNPKLLSALRSLSADASSVTRGDFYPLPLQRDAAADFFAGVDLLERALCRYELGDATGAYESMADACGFMGEMRPQSERFDETLLELELESYREDAESAVERAEFLADLAVAR